MTVATEQSITVTRIEAVNVLRFDRFELQDPGKLTVVSGANNQGKTTVLRLLGLAMRGAEGESGKVIHDGASKAVISIGLSNAYTLRRTFTEKGEYFDLLDEQGHKVPSPQKHIDKWLGEYRDFNPLAWLGMDPKDQVRVLLQAINVTLTPAEFLAATGFEALPDGVSFAGHGLLVLDDLRDHYAAARKIQNQVADQKRKAAAEARSTLPAAKPVVTAEQQSSLVTLAEEAKRLKESYEARRAAAVSYDAAKSRTEDAKARELGDNAADDREIERLEVEIERIRDRQSARLLRIDALECELTAIEASAPPTPEERDAVNGAVRHVNELRATIDAAAKILHRFADVEAMEQDANDSAAEASVIDSTIKVIDGDLRAALMAKAALPVANLSIESGRILVDGHELQYLGDAQRMRLAVAIARALRPALRVIVLDGTEAIDGPTFELFLHEIHRDQFTYLATEVLHGGCYEHRPQIEPGCAYCAGAMQIIQFGETADGVFRVAPAALEVA